MAKDRSSREPAQLGESEIIQPEEPKKRINDASDLAFWQISRAYGDLNAFLDGLNQAMYPTLSQDGQTQAWPTRSVHITQSPQVMRIKEIIQTLGSIVKEAPPETGPRRFGNVAFRTWYTLAEARVPALLRGALAENAWDHVAADQQEALTSELADYLMGSFGSPERLDYGSGHELSFIAFLCCLWKLRGFAPSIASEEERGIVVGIIEPYLELVRILIKQYNLEPAGSHGVWGLDDHSFIPYILGSAQFSPAVAAGSVAPTEGSLSGAPPTDMVTSEQQVRQFSNENMYCSALAFIYDVKRGPFWEHSPILYDISGIKKGWAKVNKGLIKMYHAEVLAKFPVVQHLRFGSLLRWEQDPKATAMAPSVHARSQPTTSVPQGAPSGSSARFGALTARPTNAVFSTGTAAPWTSPTGLSSDISTRRPPPTVGYGTGAMPPVPRFTNREKGDRPG